MCTFNTHPGHERGESGGVDSGNQLYPTTGDPPNTYNYFDALTRFYIQETSTGGPFPRDYWLDDIWFYQESRAENDDKIYSICVSVTAATGRVFLTWNRFKDDNELDHEVRYAFSDIHSLGWSNATQAPDGVVSPPGFQGANNMVYDTTAIDFGSNDTIYFAIKPSNSNVFSQVAFPLSMAS
jgi:hypothetical protein